jgi:hypothetical protein
MEAGNIQYDLRALLTGRQHVTKDSASAGQSGDHLVSCKGLFWTWRYILMKRPASPPQHAVPDNAPVTITSDRSVGIEDNDRRTSDEDISG